MRTRKPARQLSPLGLACEQASPRLVTREESETTRPNAITDWLAFTVDEDHYSSLEEVACSPPTSLSGTGPLAYGFRSTLSIGEIPGLLGSGKGILPSDSFVLVALGADYLVLRADSAKAWRHLESAASANHPFGAGVSSRDSPLC